MGHQQKNTKTESNREQSATGLEKKQQPGDSKRSTKHTHTHTKGPEIPDREEA